ncbi:MAG: hypothetical protein ACOZAA_15815 [Pseudomonadota bacterium]
MAQSGVLVALAMALLETGPQPMLRIDGDAATFAWTNCHSSPNEDWINDIVPLKDGAFLAVGFLNRVDGEAPSDWRALASKFSADGRTEWTKEYGTGGGIDAFWTARVIEDGRLVFGGLTTRIGPGGINAYLVATDAKGEILKENGYGTSGYDRITGLAPLPGGFIGAGHAEGVDGRDLFFIGVDESGVEKWRRVYAEAGSNGALYIEPAGDGGFIVSGGTSPRGDADILVMKIDAEGREIWRRLIGEAQTDDINHGLAVLDNGRIVVAGYTTSWGAGDRDIVAAVLEENGEVLSIETIGGAGDDRAMLAKKDAAGGVFIIGRTTSAGAGGVADNCLPDRICPGDPLGNLRISDGQVRDA